MLLLICLIALSFASLINCTTITTKVVEQTRNRRSLTAGLTCLQEGKSFIRVSTAVLDSRASFVIRKKRGGVSELSRDVWFSASFFWGFGSGFGDVCRNRTP